MSHAERGGRIAGPPVEHGAAVDAEQVPVPEAVAARDAVQHGVGRTMHGDPHVPNNGRRGRGLPLKPGLVIAIEPWFLESTDKIHTDPDGWTLRSNDGSRGAHAEHTVAVTADGPLVLTAP